VGDGSLNLEATLERLEAKERERATELGIDVDRPSLGKRLAKILEDHQGKLRDVLEEYGDYLEPGTCLREEALKSLRTKFFKEFTKDVELLDGADGVITGESGEVATKVGAALTDELGFAPNLLGTVVAEIRGLVEGIRGDLEARITSLSAAKRNALMAKVELDVTLEISNEDEKLKRREVEKSGARLRGGRAAAPRHDRPRDRQVQ
jgi:hypothetical protein